MGGPQKLAKHNVSGRLDARQRIEVLVDPGSFMEIGTFVGGVSHAGESPVPADALVAGMAKIDGRPVLVGSEDFTVKGGSIGLGTHAKRVRLAILAAQERVPLVMLLEGAGERATNWLERYPYAPNDLQALAELSGKVPTVAVVMGASAGHGALTAMLMDFVIMVQGAAIFSAGPPLVEAATGEKVTPVELGGVDIHVRQSGVAHNVAKDDREALALVRRYLGYFPMNAWQRSPKAASADGPRTLDGILDVIPPNPRQPYDARLLVEILADAGTVLEVQPLFGASIITALARLGGRSVAIVANQPAVRSGTIDSDAADKAAHFFEIADAFHLPTVFLADNPGIMAGTAAERSGALRSAGRMFAAQARVRSAKLHVTVRKAYGFGSSLMAMNPFDRQTITLALPGATLGAMPAGGGGTAAHADSQTQESLAAAEMGGPWAVADTMNYDEVIDPRELRNALLAALELSSGRDTVPVEPRAGGIRP
ncbi:MAG: acetyl-CoA carboxylase carboxyltransferase subunit [Chloroflexi bacterium]|nr:acetyl-CoA carboxylase carboxyltransferase subunit [Chloroflexota bacterium]